MEVLEKVVNPYRKGWSKNFDVVLWAYMIVNKTPLGMSPFRLDYGKGFHLFIELQHRAFQATKKLSLNLHDIGNFKVLQLNKLEQHKMFSYENAELYKVKTNKWRDKKCQKGELVEERDGQAHLSL